MLGQWPHQRMTGNNSLSLFRLNRRYRNFYSRGAGFIGKSVQQEYGHIAARTPLPFV